MLACRFQVVGDASAVKQYMRHSQTIVFPHSKDISHLFELYILQVIMYKVECKLGLQASLARPYTTRNHWITNDRVQIVA